MEPLFSLIIPVYNVAKYLDNCLTSIRNQTCENFEAILINDGSVDTSGDICDRYVALDKRFKVIHQENQGVTAARKRGAYNARGRYIVCVDSDDWISKNYLSFFAREIETRNSEIICYRYYYRGNHGCVVSMLTLEKYGYYNSCELKSEIFPRLIQTKEAGCFSPSLWGKAFRRELFIVYQSALTDDIKIGEDGACTMACIANAQSLSVLDECEYFYRVDNESITRGKHVFDWRSPRLINEYLFDQTSNVDFDFTEQIYRKTVHDLFSVVVSRYYLLSERKQIDADIKKNLGDECYKEALRKAVFSGSIKAKLMSRALKYKMFRVIEFYSKLKK